MLDNITLIAQSAIRIESKENKIIYFDPYRLGDDYTNDADYIFITHSHYDHFSIFDINKIINDNTKIIITEDIYDKVLKIGLEKEKILVVKPNNSYIIDNLSFSTIPSYNIDKDFHKKEFNWVGYLLNIDSKKIYIAGDTDNTLEARSIKCDIAFVPIGGKYTMNVDEAVLLIKEIKPKIVVPVHYKTIVGSVEDAYRFQKELKNIVDVEILLK